ncbi:MAG: biotin--[acetyl-CoA-carboxylase] ligase [Croceitalea sp.]|nr:biotin--[acetyl-CoA-carboxylase] ligase [Croceitalea sp.]MBT8238017.1 biotin--[acetyl-CoA-carboxylase] ligase [Croceitalea sp.]NNL08137.1 biotin--[acetyl-CoA-carboxylase] ligase [Croceitalea sp.]
MVVIKLDATDSTNRYLKKMLVHGPLADFTVVTCRHQTNGRGQMGTTWIAEKDKNLTFSILKKLTNFNVSYQFQISCLVSLGIYKVLSALSIPNLSLKWPNDIMSGNQKICGILIENILKGGFIQMSIIGIGLNVNQTQFENLDKVASLKQLQGKAFDLDNLLMQIVQQLEISLKNYKPSQWGEIKPTYENLLFKIGQPCTFKDKEGHNFMGIIKGINDAGQLLVALENDEIQLYGYKEIKMLY